MPAPASHRSGRAHFGHPVRQAVALRPVMLPDELAVTGLCGSVPVPWFRPSDPPPGARFPPQGLRRSRFPCFHGTIRRCDFLPPIPPRFVAFAWRYHPARGRMEMTGPLTFPGNPNCAFALLYDPGRTERTRPLRCDRYCPRSNHDEGSRIANFEAQSHGLSTRCLRFVGWVTPPPRKTRFRRRPSLPDGVDYPQGSNERFLRVNGLRHLILLS